MEDDELMNKKEETKAAADVPRSAGGKIINKLGKGEERDSNQTE